MEVAVVELEVVARMGVPVDALAVALCDVEHVAPVIGLLDDRWPDFGTPKGPLGRGKQREHEE